MSYSSVTATITGSSIFANQQLLGLYELDGGDNIVLDSSGTIATTQDPSFTTLTVNGDASFNGATELLGDVSFGGDISANTATFDGLVTMNDAVSVAGASTLMGDVSFGGDISANTATFDGIGVGTTAPTYGNMHVYTPWDGDNTELAKFSTSATDNYWNIDSNELSHERNSDVLSLTTSNGSVWMGNKTRSSYLKFNTDGKINVTGALEVLPNTNTTGVIGRAKIGWVGSNGDDKAAFGHYDRMDINNYALMQNNAGYTDINASSGQSIALKINNDTKMTVASSGYVGIGTTNPSSTLQVNGDGGITGTFWHNTIRPTYWYTTFRTQNLGADHHLKFSRKSGYTWARIYFGSFNNDNFNRSGENNNGKINAAAYEESSDDRLKTDEVFIENAISTIMKLKPQNYNKHSDFNKNDSDPIIESGLIAQDIYYDISELRHIVTIPSDVSVNDIQPRPEETDIQQDPDYTALGWGNQPAYLNYTQLIPWLIRGMQEQQETITTLNTTLTQEQAKTATLESQVADLLSRVSALETA